MEVNVPESLAGQWLGEATSESTNGTFLLELDRIEDHYGGWAYVWDSDIARPGFMAWVKTAGLGSTDVVSVQVQTIDPRTNEPMTPEQASALYVGAVLPTTASASIHLEDDVLHVAVVTNIPTTLTASARRSQANQPSKLLPLTSITTWASFKERIVQYKRRELIFRGQRQTQRLRTSFHRSGRADLRRFVNQDVHELRRALSSRTKRIFNLENREEYGALISLAQHHGYPTPLLDWSSSPYIAAFFAYGKEWNCPTSVAQNEKVRIFIFNVRAWTADFPQIPLILPKGPHFSVLALLAIENERLVPQQSVSTVTNVDDIEAYLLASSDRTGHTYLEAIDLPTAERSTVMTDLAFMGITAGSMMPGLDGACEELRELNFPEFL
jgi:hypothetical protein